MGCGVSYTLYYLNDFSGIEKSEQSMLIFFKQLKEHQHFHIKILLLKLRHYTKLQTPLVLQKAASV